MLIRRSIGSTASTPSTENSAQRMKVAAIVVSIARWSRSMSFAPKAWLIATPAPTEKPLKKKTIMFVIIVVEPMAARACLLTKLPTITESTVL